MAFPHTQPLDFANDATAFGDVGETSPLDFNQASSDIEVPSDSLQLNSNAPVVEHQQNHYVSIPSAALTLEGQLPSIELSANWILTPNYQTLILAGNEPTALRTIHHFAIPPPTALELSSKSPYVSVTVPGTRIVPSASLTLTSKIPKNNRSGLYHLATYDPDTFLVGDEIVSGTSTFVHTADIYQKDADGDWGVFGEDERVIKGARRVLDPDKLFATFTTTKTADLNNFTFTSNDSSTWGVTLDAVIARNRIAGNTTLNTFSSVADGTEVKIFLGDVSTLIRFYLYFNNLEGSIPDISKAASLISLRVNGNKFTGNMPSLSANIDLDIFRLNANNLSGEIADISNNTKLSIFYCYDNNLTGYAGGWPNKAFDFNASSNALTETAVNLILTEANTYGVASGTTINLSGGTNAAPTGAGATAKASLIANGATVTTN